MKKTALTTKNLSRVFLWKRKGPSERGASAVEFALLAPLFFMIVFGMFSGGLLFNEKSQMTYAAREGSRYGSTLPLLQSFTGPVDADNSAGCMVGGSSGPSGPAWACNVAKAAIAAAGGDLDTAIPNRYVCVGVVTEGTPNTVLTDVNGAAYSYSIGTAPVPAPPATCFNDGGADTSQRVHVLVQRSGSLNAVLFSYRVTLTSSAVGRLEKTPPQATPSPSP